MATQYNGVSFESALNSFRTNQFGKVLIVVTPTEKVKSRNKTEKILQRVGGHQVRVLSAQILNVNTLFVKGVTNEAF